jgi:Tetracyclin repressor-like, C-terminal domain
VADHLTVLVERTVDKRASRMLRALTAEAEAFPELHRRYFEEIVAPRREAMFEAIRRGIASGEIRSDVDVALLNEVLVAPMLARLASGNLGDLDPVAASRRITQLVLDGARPR